MSPLRRLLPALLPLLLVEPLAAQKLLPLWTASRDGQVQVYLLGSIHVGNESLFPLDPAMEHAFKASDALAVEVDIDKVDVKQLQQQVRDRAALPKGETLFDLLPSDTWFGADKVLNDYHVQLISYNDVQPWFVLWILSGLPYTDANFDPQKGIDMHFIKEAKQAQVPVISLETIDEQISTMAGMDIPQQVELLGATLGEMGDDQQSPEAILDAWKSGDTSRLQKLLLPPPGKKQGAAMAAFQRRLLDDRNVRMATRIEKLDKEHDKPVLVVVGALHMVGDDGVVSLLQAQGYTVEQVHATEGGK